MQIRALWRGRGEAFAQTDWLDKHIAANACPYESRVVRKLLCPGSANRKYVSVARVKSE